MYAIFVSGGKQYEARPGLVLKLEKVEGNVGDIITLGNVLMVADGEDVQVGKPSVEGMTITGKIVEQARARKIVVFKYKRRKGYSRKLGHRQHYTAVRIEGIGTGEPQQA